jgi:hypothetical protein
VGPAATRRRVIHRKKSKSRKRRATKKREDSILKLLTLQAKVFDQMALQTSEKRKEDTAKSSLLVAWTDRLISAKNWDTAGHPPYNTFLKEASEDKMLFPSFNWRNAKNSKLITDLVESNRSRPSQEEFWLRKRMVGGKKYLTPML